MAKHTWDAPAVGRRPTRLRLLPSSWRTMAAAEGKTIWCYACEQRHSIDIDAALQCPQCESDFIEEVAADAAGDGSLDHQQWGEDAALPLAAAMQNLLRPPAEAQADTGMPGTPAGPRSSAPLLHLLMGLLAQGQAREGTTGLEGLGNFLMQLRDQDGDGDDDLEGLLHRLHQEAEDAPSTPTSSEGLAAIKTELLRALTSEPVDCAVCKDKVEQDKMCKMLPCTHFFHPDCIAPWLESHSSCPVCRFDLNSAPPTPTAPERDYDAETLTL